MLLALMNHLRKADLEVRNMTWDREGNRGYELNKKTVALLGYGNMGMTFARKLSGLSCKVLAYDKYKANYGDKFARESSMDYIYEKADVLSVHVPLTEETRFMIDETFFDRFHKPVYFLNTARGEIVRLSALVNSLKKGSVSGAALDVLENEKLATLTDEQRKAFDFLRSREDVLFSPHVGGWSFESYVRINEVLVSKLTDWRSSL
jgi:D-3-phosphoglycerate dehydrogenase